MEHGKNIIYSLVGILRVIYFEFSPGSYIAPPFSPQIAIEINMPITTIVTIIPNSPRTIPAIENPFPLYRPGFWRNFRKLLMLNTSPVIASGNPKTGNKPAMEKRKPNSPICSFL